MISPSVIDIRTFLKTLLQSLQPLAKKKNIKLNFTADKIVLELDYPESELHTGFTKLIHSIIEYMPVNNTIYLNAGVIEKKGVKCVSVKIRNTGINLKMVTGIVKNTSLPVTLFSSSLNETTFEVNYALRPDEHNVVEIKATAINYISIVKGIQTHFAKLNNPVARLAETKPKEAAFLTNIHKCILDHLDDERFDANALSNAMAMSRSQLLRRLKTLTGNSPGFYIKKIRLEKAKELLESTDYSVSEVAFKTGFATPSNFSKVFAEKFGMTPSQFLRINSNATNQ